MSDEHDHHRISPDGKACGEQLARLCEKALVELANEGEPDERCKTCAFRRDTVPNGCIQTQADAMKCVMEAIPFFCHQRKGELCFGWYASRVTLRGRTTKVPWELSKP